MKVGYIIGALGGIALIALPTLALSPASLKREPVKIAVEKPLTEQETLDRARQRLAKIEQSAANVCGLVMAQSREEIDRAKACQKRLVTSAVARVNTPAMARAVAEREQALQQS